MAKSLHELSKEYLNKANLEVLTETGKLKVETPKEVVKEETDLDESTRKHFRQVADVIKAHPDAAKRKELAAHHSEIFAKQNPRFDKKKFHAAANAELDEGVNGEHGPDDDEDSLDRIERKKQHQERPPFKPDAKKSTDWSSAKNKAKNLARAAMKKQVEKKK